MKYNNIKLIPLKECINEYLYDMYQDIPKEEVGSINKINGVDYDKFLKIINEYIKEEININPIINTTTLRYVLFVHDLPIGELGIRTTINEFWKNNGSQIYYKIRMSERGKGYGNIILKLGLQEAKRLGFNEVRINCDNNNIASKKVILNNGGKPNIINYKTENGYSTSYIINLNNR